MYRPRGGRRTFKMLQKGRYAGKADAAFVPRKTVWDDRHAAGSLLLILDEGSGVFFVFGDVVVGLEDVSLEGGEVFDGRVGHECGADVWWHHHDGGAGAVT